MPSLLRPECCIRLRRARQGPRPPRSVYSVAVLGRASQAPGPPPLLRPSVPPRTCSDALPAILACLLLPRCDSHRNCVWLTRLTRASNRFDSLARSIRSNLPQCLTTGAMRRIDLACRLTETVAELVSSRFAFKATGPAPQLQLLFSRPPYPHKREADSDLYQRQRLNTEFTGLSRG